MTTSMPVAREPRAVAVLVKQASYSPTMRTYWLKSIGSSDDPQAEDWVDSAPQELTEVHFPKGKPSVAVGDYLVYYASGTSKIVGIVEVNSTVTMDSSEERWPWRCDVKPHLVLGSIDERAPALESVLLPPHTTKSVMQQSHIRLTEEEYRRALEGLEDVFDSDKGDLLSDWPFFRTRLKERAAPSRRSAPLSMKTETMNDTYLLGRNDRGSVLHDCTWLPQAWRVSAAHYAVALECSECGRTRIDSGREPTAGFRHITNRMVLHERGLRYEVLRAAWPMSSSEDEFLQAFLNRHNLVV